MQLPACTRVLPRPSTHRFVLGLFSTDDPIIPKDLAILYPTKLRFLVISYDFCDLAQEKSCFSSCFLSICQRTFHISPLIFTIFYTKRKRVFPLSFFSDLLFRFCHCHNRNFDLNMRSFFTFQIRNTILFTEAELQAKVDVPHTIAMLCCPDVLLCLFLHLFHIDTGPSSCTEKTISCSSLLAQIRISQLSISGFSAIPWTIAFSTNGWRIILRHA